MLTNSVIMVFLTFVFYYKYQETGCSPLSTACKCGAVASAELLLKYGANPNGCKNVSVGRFSVSGIISDVYHAG